MNTATEMSLYDALLQTGRVPVEQREHARKVFAEFADDPVRLADELLAAKFVTRYQHRKIQAGRPGELVFGQYLILERIGEGGMGKVYRAVETRMGREVALKTIRPNLLANKTVVLRYKREARAAASLEHPNIVKLLEADDVGGRYFLAMEFVDGSDLSRLVKDLNKDKVSMPPGEAAEYIRQAALGLQHAHDKGLVHRDVKPSNLLVAGERAIPGTGGKANVKILDMGLVRSLADDDVTTTDLTRDGTVVGTPDYMSPEQSRNSSTVDPRADIYSLGCTLFYLLRGLPPYDTGTAIDKLIKHQLDPVPDIRQYRPDVPPRLAAVIKKMMSKKADDRYQTADEVAEELAHHTGDPAFDLNALPPLPGLHLADIPDIPVMDASPAAPKSGYGFPTMDLAAAATPAPTYTPPAAPVQLPTAPVLASESGARSGARPVARPAAAPVPPPSQRSVRVVTVQAKPIAKRPADATPSGDTETTGRGRTSDTPAGGSSSPRRTARRTPDKKPKGGLPVLALAAAGVGGVALIVVLAVLVALTGRNDKPAATTAAVATRPAAPPPPKVAKSPYRPVAELLPDDTAAVLVVDPKVGWEQAQANPEATTQSRRVADVLARWFKFDLRKFDRVTVAFEPNMSHAVAAGEGEALKGDAFRKDLDRAPLAEIETLPNGAVVVRNAPGPKVNPFNAERRPRGVLWPNSPAYLIASGKSDLVDLAKTADTRKGPTGVDPALLRAAADATKSADTPLAFFAASGDCQLPLKPVSKGKPDPLSAFGVDLMTVTAAPAAGGNLRLTVVLTGTDGRTLARFLEKELPLMLEAMVGRELANPLANPITEAAQGVKPTDAGGGRKQLTASFEWPWAAALPVVEALMPESR